MHYRLALWPASAAAGVQDQRRVVRGRVHCRFLVFGTRDANPTLVVHLTRVDRNTSGFRSLACLGLTLRRTEQNLRGCVFEIKAHLVLAITRIQGSRGTGN